MLLGSALEELCIDLEPQKPALADLLGMQDVLHERGWSDEGQFAMATNQKDREEENEYEMEEEEGEGEEHPLRTLEMMVSPMLSPCSSGDSASSVKSCRSLLWGVLPFCSKCLFLPSKPKTKEHASEHTHEEFTAAPGFSSSFVGCSENFAVGIPKEGSQSKGIGRAKQMRFIEDAEKDVQKTSGLHWASYGLF